MNENLKTNIVQKLENMTDEAGRQLLDYIEFLESKFNRSTRERSTLERLAENVEGTLRSNPIGEAAIKGTGGIIDAAGSVARGVAAAGQAVFDELQQVVDEVTEETPETADAADETKTDDSAGDGSEGTGPIDSDPPEAPEEHAPEGEAGGEKTSA
jgi:hypothetical protein